MPIRAFRKFRKHHRRVAGRKAGGRRARHNAPPRSMPAIAEAGRGQTCSIVETIQFPDIKSNTGYAYIFTLSQFNRAKALAPQFQYYKAAKVTWTYEVLYNTFQEGSNFSKPYMFTIMDRTQQVTDGSLQYLQHAGARSVAFTKTQHISYVPNWCSPGAMAVIYNTDGTISGINAQGYQKQYSWIESPTQSLAADNPADIQNYLYTQATLGAGAPQPTTSNNKCVYNGHRAYVDQSPGDANLISRVTCTVHWLFKGARYSPMATAPPYVPPTA